LTRILEKNKEEKEPETGINSVFLVY